MSDIKALSDLANFVAKSPLASEDVDTRQAAINDIVGQLRPRRVKAQRSSDLLGVVMALSARTRRIVQPRIEVDVDVFAPNGKRAVTIIMGDAV